MSKFTINCPCLFGLESVLSGEIKRLGGANVQVSDGRVSFLGDLELVAKANLWLRTAERVQIVLGAFRATTFEELFQGVLALPLEQFIGPKDAFPVKGWSLNSRLHSVPDCQSIIKKAAVNRLSQVYGIHWFQETGPVHQLQFSIIKDKVSILLDTSGAGLHKRGYRPSATAAPIKETLAAGMLDLVRIYPDTQFFDPFCGSGTILIEAALKALNIAPGLKRTFACEKWDVMPQQAFRRARQEALDVIRRDAPFHGIGSDVDPAAVELCQANVNKAGVSARVKVKCQDVRTFQLPEGRVTVVTNPPYGERILDVQQARELYRAMGQVLVPREGLRMGIITPEEAFEAYFGHRSFKRRKLYNGMIKCQLYLYGLSSRAGESQ